MRDPEAHPWRLAAACAGLLAALLAVRPLGAAQPSPTGTQPPPAEAQPPALDGEALAQRIEGLTGGRTRIVWTRLLTKTHGNPYKSEFIVDRSLVGFDTATGEEHVIVPGPMGCFMPRLTHDGSRVLFTDMENKEPWVVNWDGTGLQCLLKPTQTHFFVMGSWRDPADGVEWVYFSRYRDSNSIYRSRLDGSGKPELFWAEAMVQIWLSLSRDGKRMGTAFGWPRPGVANLETREWESYDKGCVPHLAPDDSYRLFHLDGGHQRITMYDADGENRRKIALRPPQWVEAREREAWPVRWTTDERFITLSGPFLVHTQWAPADVYLGKFDDEYTVVEEWIRVTSRPDVMDFEPFAHVASPATGNDG